MTFRSHWFVRLLLASAALGARVAHADPTPAELATARQAFESAVALEAEQKWLQASKQLRQALAVKDTPGLRFHLAHCEERQGFLVEAALDYDRASELLQQGAKAPDVQKLLAPASADLKKRIPVVSVEIPSDVPSPGAALDSKAYAVSELALGVALNPGPHRLEVSAPGRRPMSNAFSLKEGDRVSIRVDLPGTDPPANAVTAPPSADGAPTPGAPRVESIEVRRQNRGPAPKFYLLAGESAVTAFGLAFGIGYALAQSSAHDRVQAEQHQIDAAAPNSAVSCGTPSESLNGACSDLHRAIDDYRRDRTLSSVGFVCAGVGAAALLTTWIAYPSRPSGNSGPAVGLVVAPGRVALQGRF